MPLHPAFRREAPQPAKQLAAKGLAAKPAKSALPYVWVKRPRCHFCRSFRLRSYKTRRNGDGSLTRYAVCRDCGQKMKVVVE